MRAEFSGDLEHTHMLTRLNIELPRCNLKQIESITHYLLAGYNEK
jgi:hypothetical protein